MRIMWNFLGHTYRNTGYASRPNIIFRITTHVSSALSTNLLRCRTPGVPFRITNCCKFRFPQPPGKSQSHTTCQSRFILISFFCFSSPLSPFIRFFRHSSTSFSCSYVRLLSSIYPSISILSPVSSFLSCLTLLSPPVQPLLCPWCNHSSVISCASFFYLFLFVRSPPAFGPFRIRFGCWSTRLPFFSSPTRKPVPSSIPPFV